MMSYGGPMNRRTFSPEGYGQTVASGGMRGGPRAGPGNRAGSQGGMAPTSGGVPMQYPPSYTPPFLPNGGASLPGPSPTAMGYANALGGQVKAYGDMQMQDFRKNAGEMLGNLNGIGALRSGAVASGMNDLTTNYSRNVGNYAAMTAGQGLEMGQREEDLQSERAFRERQYKDAKKASRSRGIGKLLGAGLGIASMFVPGGTVAGKVIGGVMKGANVF